MISIAIIFLKKKPPNNAKPESGSPFSEIPSKNERPSAGILRFTITKPGKMFFENKTYLFIRPS